MRAAGCSQHLLGSLLWNMARRMRGVHVLAVLFTCSLTLFGDADGQGTINELTGFSLSPPYFNLAQGSSISATATCGQDEGGTPRRELYCKLVGGPTTGALTQNIQGQFCDYCDKNEPSKAHPVTNAIDGTERWWQSPPLSRGLGYNEVNVTLDLGQLFHVAYILIKFANSPRPDLWVLEHSVDNGRTFIPWQYFAHSKRECIERFRKQPNARIVNDDDQICTTEYSTPIPLENGEIVVSLVNGRPGSRNFTYSPVLQDFTKATNIRLRFLRTSTLLGHLISKAQRDPTVTRRYYYSIKDISIGGRCVCHGHAQECGAGRSQDRPSRLQCECRHNTCGESCDRCCPGFNQKPWRPATVHRPNECHPCQCFSHASDCYYDPEVEARRASLDTFGRYDGGGVCTHCQHNTAGVNCERCHEGFYRPHGVPPESPSGCIPCRCDERTTAGCDMGSGRCICKPHFTGENCDRCADGYYNYPQCTQPTPCPPGYFGPPTCQQCVCDRRGTVDGVCDASGRCLCRSGVEGERCDRCPPGYHSFPNCQVGPVCRCDGAGVADSRCSPNGQCVCLPNYGGRGCDQCAPGYYGYPDCAAPFVECNAVGTGGRDSQTGACRCRANVEGNKCDRCKPFYWNLAAGNPGGCTACRCEERTSVGCEMGSGRCICKPQFTGENCDRCAYGYYNYPQCTQSTTCPPGYFGPPTCQQCVCDRRGTVDGVCDASGRCLCRSGVEGERCDRCPPGYHSFPNCQVRPVCCCDGTGEDGSRCSTTCECGCLPNYTGPDCDQCAPGYYGYPDCVASVECNAAGTEGTDPQTGACRCLANVEGNKCDRCKPFYWNLAAGNPGGCTACRCEERTSVGCEMGTGRCICKPQFTGENCDRCAYGYYNYPQCTQSTTCPPGYFGPPTCQQCVCDRRGTVDGVCDASGRCLCRSGVEGERCDRCPPGYHSFPNCQVGPVCRCDGAGVADSRCSPNGQCVCLLNYGGRGCDQCAPGYYGYPDCAACQCSQEGSHGSECNPQSGQCLCLPGVLGQRCDRCASGLRFPQCSAPIVVCNKAGSEGRDSQTGACSCLPNVEGTKCDSCKPLYWNLAPGNPRGCTECQCDVKGTLSGVGECLQTSGQCFCKPNACGLSCETCKDGYYLPQRKNYLGCQGCECDVGGAIGMACDDTTGQCWCRKNVVGRTCTEPAPSYYFPTLHQLKFEVEDGTTPNARPVLFGYDPHVFPGFSWRGYAVMSPAQNEVRVTVHVEPKDGRQHVFRVVLRFTNPSGAVVTSSILATKNRGMEGGDQSKEVIFPRSPSPSFLTVPGEGFAEPFTLTPGKWIIQIKAEGVLLDYLVLLPQAYYEAPLLQEKITQPCTYLPTEDRDTKCLLYKHVPMEGFSSALGSEGTLSSRSGRRRRQTRVRRPTPDHPEMADLNGRQSQLQLSVRVPRPGLYALVLEYASEGDIVQNVNILIRGQSGGQIPARANVYSCAYSFLCRSVAVDSSNKVTVMQLDHKTDFLLQTSTASFLLYKLYAVPAEEFSMEYVEPKVICVSTQGRFTVDSRFCVPRQFDKPTSSIVLLAARDGQLSAPDLSAPRGGNEDWRRRRQIEPPIDGILLKYPETEITFSAKSPLLGRHVVVVHFRQPEHTSFPVEVRVDAGRQWNGSINASFCPGAAGCRAVVVANGRIALDFDQSSWQLPTVSLSVPPRKTLVMDYIMLVPDSLYSPDLLKEKLLDKSAEFPQQCRGEGFYIDPKTSSQFCRASARSLVMDYNNGALPCDCDKSGSTGPACEPAGGQCPCREHVIGQRCTKCATGYYSFPSCRPCNCGGRLCDEVTGACICPPQTVQPSCVACLNHTFSYHPLLGCQDCECSADGSSPTAGTDCDRGTGQCSCKPRIGGRKCDRCAIGYYRFPDCVPCACNRAGVTPGVCDPDTGKCLCKRNVAGVRCTTCRDGAFYFDPSNPQGCTSCFCFGATDRCQSSSKRRGKLVEMGAWRLERADRQEELSGLNSASNTMVADIQELPPTVRTLHWVAPPSYLGDRVSSYGGFLTYQSKSFGIPSEGMELLDRSPDVVLTGQGMTLVHMAPQAPLPDKLYQGRVQLLEGKWRHAVANRPVSREELMAVLAHLEGLRIRALYFSHTQRLSLGQVGLEGATDTGTGGGANTVEDCSCPPNYTGDSCQKCAPGFYRDRTGSYLGRCMPCECNGLSDECEDRTGKCLNCQHNTAGDRCEHCKEGYYGNAALKTCKACPCPYSQPGSNFAIGCREFFGVIQCVCRKGYIGDKCERCAPGYYGDPLSTWGSCRPCDCKGIGNNCDSRTGVCKNTLEPGDKDTDTDEHCQECDNCAQTLLKDLEQLDDELGKIKARLDNASSSGASQDLLDKLEKDIADTQIIVKKFTLTINTVKTNVNQVELDTKTLSNDINSLKDKADKGAADADKAVTDVGKTHTRAKDLDEEIKNLLKKIQALLDQLNEPSGDKPNDNLGKLLEEAQRMVKEMEKRDFTPQKTAAEEEKDKAQKLLDHIKANVSKQCDKNEAETKKIQDKLSGYQDKLKDLDKALQDARALVGKANDQNTANSKAMGDLKKRINDLKLERSIVQDQIDLTEKELKKSEGLAKTLADSLTEYEQLAAELDGTKSDLTKKVDDISKAAKKEDIVMKAEAHAKNLEENAKRLEDALKDSSGRPEVRNAKDAIDAYKNITDAVNAAEKAANEAKGAADDAFNKVKNEKLPDKARDLKGQGGTLLAAVDSADADLQNAALDLTELKDRLKKDIDTKTDLQGKLLGVKDRLDNIKRDDIGKLIDEAKNKAGEADQTASNTLDKLKDIEKEINKISVTPGDSNLNDMLDDVDKSVNNLKTTIPSLDKKISEIDNLTSQFSIDSISDNIKRIKELIELARDAANSIEIPMLFKGDGYVEMRQPKDLEDLKAYTSMVLKLQRPETRGDGRRRRRQTAPGNMFVLYLGNRDSSSNYIGMYLRNNMLHGVYKLNGKEQVMTLEVTTASKLPNNIFDKVELRRIYQDAVITLTKDYTNKKDTSTRKGKLDEDKNLLDLNPADVVFYVGGYPDDFTPPPSLQLPKYKGCIEFTSLNDQHVSLYNFQKVMKINEEDPCNRHLVKESSTCFMGTGYAKVNLENKDQARTIIEMNILSHSENGLIYFQGNEENYITVTVEQGVVVLRGNRYQTKRFAKKIFPTRSDKTWPTLRIVLVAGEYTAIIAASETFKIPEKPGIIDSDVFYIGGAPQGMREKHNITMQPFKGCIKGFKLDGSYPTLREEVGITRGDPNGLLTIRKAEFTPRGFLRSEFPQNVAGDVTMSLGFRSTEAQGVILHDKQAANGIALELDSGFLILNLNNEIMKSNSAYNDGQWHYVTATKRGTKILLMVDDTDMGAKQTGSKSIADTGGKVQLGSDQFKGCISNLYMRRQDNVIQPEDLSYFSSTGTVFTDMCTADGPAQLMVDTNSKKDPVMQAINESVSGCALPATVPHAYRIGGPVSRLTYSLPLHIQQPRTHFSLDVRTRSPEGLLFFAATRGGRSHMALYVSKGRIRLSVGKQKEIFNREKYNDGKWHSVIFSVEKKKFRLVVDGIRAQDGQLTNVELSSMQLVSHTHLGSAPKSLHHELKSKAIPKQSVYGCIRNFQMNGEPMSKPTTNVGAGPCFEGQTQRGAYFGGNGAHVITNGSFVVGPSFELLFSLRPRTLSGLLLHVGASMNHSLSVYMTRGEVVARVNNGQGEFMVAVKPKASLCDGMFHKISVIKRKNVVQLHVDTTDSYKIGPTSPTTTLTKDSLYVGGIPDTQTLQTLPVTASLVGCIQDMSVNSEPVSFDKLSSVFGPVNLRECPG